MGMRLRILFWGRLSPAGSRARHRAAPARKRAKCMSSTARAPSAGDCISPSTRWGSWRAARSGTARSGPPSPQTPPDSVIYGAGAGDLLPAALLAFDVIGDSARDIIVSTSSGPEQRVQAGAVYIIAGSAALPRAADLAAAGPGAPFS